MPRNPPGGPCPPGGLFVLGEGLSGRWQKPLFWLFAALAVSSFFVPEINPDLFWHLSAGRWMAEHKTVPRADFLSHTMAGRPWCDFEWLTQLIYYPVYELAGYPGFIALRLALLCSLLAVALALLRFFELSVPVRGAAALFIMEGQNLSLRPDLVSLCFAGLAFLALERLRAGRARPGAGGLALWAGLFCLWANLHLGFAMGLTIIGFFAAGELIESSLPRIYGGDWGSRERLWGFAAVLAVAAAGSLANPYGWRIYGVLFEHNRLLPVLQDLINEWQPADITNAASWPYWVAAAFILAATLAHFIATRRTPYAHLLTVCYLLVMSSTHVRLRTFLFLLGIPLALRWVRELGPGPRWRWALGAAGSCAVAAAVHGIVTLYWPASPFFSKVKWCSEPAWVMVRYLEGEPQLQGRRLYNTWHHGGYLGWRLYPGTKVFFDGRYIFHDLLVETRAAMRRPATWQAFLDKHRVEVACLQRSSGYYTLEMIKGRGGKKAVGGKPFYRAYMPEDRWALVYWDDANLVMARRSSFDPRWLAANEFRRLLPDAAAVDTSRRALPELLRESARHLRQTRGSGLEDRGLQRWLTALLANKR